MCDFFDESKGETSINATDMHSGGSPMRVITGGLPEIKGSSYKERLNYVKNDLDYLRVFLTNEPRGYREMTVIVPIQHDEGLADHGAVFISSTTYLQFCGEATICFSRYLVDQGLVKYQEPEAVYTLQAPCGLVTCYVACAGGKAGEVRFHGAPSYICSLNSNLKLSNGSNVQASALCGSGMLYIIADQTEFEIDLSSFDYRNNMYFSTALESAADQQIKLPPHFNDRRNKPFDGSIIRQSVAGSTSSSHLTVVDKTMVNRGFCGSATSSCATLDYFNGLLKLGETRKYASVVTNGFASATPVRKCTFEGYDAVIIEIRGASYYTGKHTFFFEKDDPLKKGFLG